MRLISTRQASDPVRISQAIRVGQAPDGGLYMPSSFPSHAGEIANRHDDLPGFAAAFLHPFFDGDDLQPHLAQICAGAFDIPLPDNALSEHCAALELFHGPTGAFKDFGARFLMACLEQLSDRDAPFTVLAATSGDTGGAVGCAAEGLSGVRAVLLYPDGRVSPFQAHQLSCWREPVTTLKVSADFDACQRLVKSAFADPELAQRYNLTSANSINIARLLAQAAYLAFAVTRRFKAKGVQPGLIIPTGNLGHGLAAFIARACGAPVGPILLATNANATLRDWFQSGDYQSRPSIQTMANAMDVGAPSNFERLSSGALALDGLGVERVEDDVIRARIDQDYRRYGYVWCPHSACAAEAYARLPSSVQQARPWLIAATAHPFKFAESVEPVIGVRMQPSPDLASVLSRSTRAKPCEPDLDALAAHLEDL